MENEIETGAILGTAICKLLGVNHARPVGLELRCVAGEPAVITLQLVIPTGFRDELLHLIEIQRFVPAKDPTQDPIA